MRLEHLLSGAEERFLLHLGYKPSKTEDTFFLETLRKILYRWRVLYSKLLVIVCFSIKRM